MKIANRYVEAFKERFNVVGMATAAAVSAATLTPLPLLAALVAEAAYLIFVPDSKWYDARLSRRYDAEVERRREKLREQILPTLRPELQDTYARLERIRREMNPASAEGAQWLREVLRKLDYLLEKFLMFASKEVQFRSHLKQILSEVRGGHFKGGRRQDEFELDISLPRIHDLEQARSKSQAKNVRKIPPPKVEAQSGDADDRWVSETIADIQRYYDKEIAEVDATKQQETDSNTLAVLDKRLDVLTRRKEFVGKMERILVNLNHQIHLVEDTFGLINDEIRARSPEQILADIEDVVGQTDTMTKVLEEMAPYEHMVERMRA